MSNICVITGSSGLIGSESVSYMSDKFDLIVGIDNDMRSYFFGPEASTEWKTKELEEVNSNFESYKIDIRDKEAIFDLFRKFGDDVKLIIHAAAQPSHDWAAKEPFTDFSVNATGTLNLLEATRSFCRNATFVFTSTNKVYGDTPNKLPLIENEARWEIDKNHEFFEGIDETMSIDNSVHSLFGASKVSADLLVQEYGKYFGMNTGVFRGGCLTGPNHSGAQLHGFLSYLMKCAITGDHYTIFGYKGKQVRDNIHSWDLVNMFWFFHQNPMKGEVYNAGGGRFSNCSMKEAISKCESIAGKKMNYSYSETNRIGDHIWYISNLDKFKRHYPDWTQRYDLDSILEQMYGNMKSRFDS